MLLDLHYTPPSVATLRLLRGEKINSETGASELKEHKFQL